jgi:hypothetical protein
VAAFFVSVTATYASTAAGRLNLMACGTPRLSATVPDTPPHVSMPAATAANSDARTSASVPPSTNASMAWGVMESTVTSVVFSKTVHVVTPVVRSNSARTASSGEDPMPAISCSRRTLS